MGAPILLSYLIYVWGAPSTSVNYGELIETRPLPEIALRKLDGKFAAVTPLHSLQDHVVAGLQRQVHMRHDARLAGNQIE